MAGETGLVQGIFAFLDPLLPQEPAYIPQFDMGNLGLNKEYGTLAMNMWSNLGILNLRVACRRKEILMAVLRQKAFVIV